MFISLEVVRSMIDRVCLTSLKEDISVYMGRAGNSRHVRMLHAEERELEVCVVYDMKE